MVYVFFADGFEEIEAVTIVDVLRRGGVEVATVGIGSRSTACALKPISPTRTRRPTGRR